jgi:hypothetical protein
LTCSLAAGSTFALRGERDTATAASTRSVADAVYVTTAPAALVASRARAQR